MLPSTTSQSHQYLSQNKICVEENENEKLFLEEKKEDLNFQMVIEIASSLNCYYSKSNIDSID